MGTSIKELHNRFYTLPDNIRLDEIPSNFYRTYVWTNHVYLYVAILHFSFIFFFMYLGVRELSLFNVLSVLLWILALAINLKGHLTLGYSIGNIEVVAHALLCTIYLGWESGFHYYVLTFPVALFAVGIWTVGRTILLIAANALAYVLIFHFSQYSNPLSSLSPGVINILNYANMVSFCLLLGIMGYYITIAVRKAEEEVEREHKRATSAFVERNKALMRLNGELAEAADYVRTMLPEPIFEGTIKTDWRFIPSTSLGGDAFGYHWLDDEHFVLYLIDVSGHGVGAALLSVSVLNVLRSQSLPNTDFKDPEQVLKSLNAAFPGEENNDMFFTMWYGVYNQNKRELTYASGGHPPALLLSDTTTDNAQVILLSTHNNVVGGMLESKYQKQKERINKRSTLYIFSDGVYEVEKSDGSMWKFKEFSDFMSKLNSDGLSRLDRLNNYARSIGDSEIFDDDFTILEVTFS